jgi:hypothetical protein
MSKPQQPKWAVGYINRRWVVEDLCEHGIGHPNAVWLRGRPGWAGVHGCDGCCRPGDRAPQQDDPAPQEEEPGRVIQTTWDG